jgi:uncharacterized protein YbjT (DUF2867 family)
MIGAFRSALVATAPSQVVILSSIGADAPHTTTLARLGLLENQISSIPFPTVCLRAAWFMENAAEDVATALREGVVHSFLQPATHKIPMVSALDVGRCAAQLMQQSWQGKKVVELEVLFGCRRSKHLTRYPPRSVARSKPGSFRGRNGTLFSDHRV